MTVYRQGLPPDVEHRWLRWRRRCTCGWTQRQGPNPFRHTGSGFVRLSLDPPINYPYHLEDMAEWEEQARATCIETASCEEGDHTYSWPCELAQQSIVSPPAIREEAARWVPGPPPPAATETAISFQTTGVASRDELANIVARMWAEDQGWGADMPLALVAALDRLAHAYGLEVP